MSEPNTKEPPTNTQPEPPSASALNTAISACTKAVETLPRDAQRRVLTAAAALLGLDGPAPAPRGASSQQRPPNGQQQQQQRGRS